MLVAQRLYEGIEISSETVGLITYMRTDSTRLSETFVKPTLSYIKKEFGDEYKGHYKTAKAAKNAQDAHEAIRPTDVYRTPASMKKYLKPDEYKLYRLIYRRAVSSLMNPAVLETRSLDLSNTGYVFKASAQKMVFDGYLKLYRNDTHKNYI